MKKQEEIVHILKEADQAGKIDPADIWRCGYHFTPKAGWLNDPNGLCYFQGYYHVFFQYAPAFPKNGGKAWAHYRSRDLISWEYLGMPLYPDCELDKDGAYSGSALVEDDTMYLFYTGNVKEAGTHDYTHSGRLSNTILVESKDGIHFSEKKCVMDNSAYPAHYTCHIRDPKVSGGNGEYYMVLGGRTDQDKGTMLLYYSYDKEQWHFARELTTADPFGYMWECPDMFTIEGNSFIGICPQGLDAEPARFQNNHQAGYFPLMKELVPENFQEWDMGFDFYAPQIFKDNQNRTLLIGWIGLPDEPYGNPDIQHGWTQALTVPRELTLNNGRLYQYPAKELEGLRGKVLAEQKKESIGTCSSEGAEPGTMSEAASENWKLLSKCSDWLMTKDRQEAVTIYLGEGENPTAIESEQQEHRSVPEPEPAKGLELNITETEITLTFLDDSGAGRTVRRAVCNGVEEIRILADASVLELYFNHGEIVMTTRIYQKTEGFQVYVEGRLNSSVIYEMKQEIKES